MARIYILTKLYNINDRYNSLELNNLINNWIKNSELKMFDELCFLPYRDSNDKVKDKKNKTYEIFKMDCSTIIKSNALVGFCDGPVYDSGIGFEIGYAYANKIPVILLTSDYYFRLIDNKKYSISPLAASIADIIHIRFPEQERNYIDNLNSIKDKMFEKLKEKLQNISECKEIAQINNDNLFDVFIDINFTVTDSGKLMLKKMTDAFTKAGKTFYIGALDDYETAETIFNIIGNSKTVIIYGDAIEPDFDSCIVQGIAFAKNKKIILYSSIKENLFQAEDFILEKNPMIQHSAICMENIDDIIKSIF